MKNIVLFDMDGTLTEPRKKIEHEMVEVINSLLSYSDAEVGIVSGSGIDYIFEQCNLLFNSLDVDKKLRMYIFPCNGTKYYGFNQETGGYSLVSNSIMRDEIGDVNYQLLVRSLLSCQKDVCTDPLLLGMFSLSGHFISDRESMINWCPIGRDSSFSKRNEFKKVDVKNNIRKKCLSLIRSRISESKDLIDNLEFALGGSTSIDIYPSGWNKTFCLRYLPDARLWFVGDKCEKDGNDKEIYELISKDYDGNAYKTDGPGTTYKIITDNILPAFYR